MNAVFWRHFEVVKGNKYTFVRVTDNSLVKTFLQKTLRVGVTE